MPRKKATLFLPEAAKACYDGFLAELKLDKDARVKAFEQLPAYMRERWARVAMKVYDAMIGAKISG